MVNSKLRMIQQLSRMFNWAPTRPVFRYIADHVGRLKVRLKVLSIVQPGLLRKYKGHGSGVVPFFYLPLAGYLIIPVQIPAKKVILLKPESLFGCL